MTIINVSNRSTRIGTRWQIEVGTGLDIDEGIRTTLDLTDEAARTLWGKLGSALELATADPEIPEVGDNE